MYTMKKTSDTTPLIFYIPSSPPTSSPRRQAITIINLPKDPPVGCDDFPLNLNKLSMDICIHIDKSYKMYVVWYNEYVYVCIYIYICYDSWLCYA